MTKADIMICPIEDIQNCIDFKTGKAESCSDKSGFPYCLSMAFQLGGKPFRGEILEIENLCSSDSVFSPDSEYSFGKS